MMARARGNAVPVKMFGNIPHTVPIYNKGKHTGLGLRCSNNVHTRQVLKLLRGVFEQSVLVRGNGGQANALQVVHRRSKPDRTGYIGGSGLKLFWQTLELGMGKGYIADHMPTSLPGGHGFQQVAFAIQNANACWPVYFMARKNQKIRIQCRHIERQMRGGLRRINQHRYPGRVRKGYDLLNRVNGAQRIGNMRDRNQLCAARKECCKMFQQQFPPGH